MKVLIFLISSAFCYFQFNGNNTESNYDNSENIEYQDTESEISHSDNEEDIATSDWDSYDQNDVDSQSETEEQDIEDQNDSDPQTMTDEEEVQDQSGYTSDNNPVTWDEDPSNYPTERPTTYDNVDDIEVQSPTHYNAVPPGACAVCGDGTYSFSRNRRGTCSRHGGVSRWLK